MDRLGEIVRRFWRRDAIVVSEVRVVVVLFFVAACAGMVYSATWGGEPQFWRHTTFMQGISWLCGAGWENPKVSEVPGLEAFLYGHTDCFDCENMPDGVTVLPRDVSGMTVEEIDTYHPQHLFFGFLPWQRYHLYFVWTVTALWAVFGLCWSSLTPLVGLLTGMTGAALYGVFRLGVRRGLAIVATLWVVFSPLHLQMTPHIRDYSKAPFLILILFLLGCLLKYPMARRSFFALSAVCGIVVGIGVGFRTDLAIAAPACVVVLLFFTPGTLRETWVQRLGATAIFCGVLSVTGLPIFLELFKEAGHFFHVTSLGFLKGCDMRLGVGNPLYHLGDPFNDLYIVNVVQGFSHRVTGEMPPSTHWDVQYHEATQLFFKAFVKLFPADMVLRAYAATLRVVDELAVNVRHPYPHGITNLFLCRLFEWRALLEQSIPGMGRYHVLAALALLAGRRMRWAFGITFLLFFFAGYTALQFYLRHAFHLEFIAVWATVFLGECGLWGMSSLYRRHCENQGLLCDAAWRSWLGKGVLRSILFFLIVGLGLGGVLQGLRWVQDRQVTAFLTTFEQTPLTPVAVTSSKQEGNNEIVYSFSDFGKGEPRGPLPTQYEYLVVVVENGLSDVTLHFDFDKQWEWEWFNFSRDILVSGKEGEGITRIFFPVYFGMHAQFQGVYIEGKDEDRIRGFYTTDLDTVPIWPTLVLPEDWRDAPKHQVLVR